jgi:hypothetical protein
MKSLEFLDGEQWKVVPGFHDYLVSNMGRVFSLKASKLLVPDYKRNDYANYVLSSDGKNAHILGHRMVYEAFRGSIPKGFEVNHKDENKHNNRLDNLELVTRSENVKYGTALKRRGNTRRTNSKERGGFWGNEKPCMNINTGKTYPSVKIAAADVCGKATSIANVCGGSRKTYRGEKWIYIIYKGE